MVFLLNRYLAGYILATKRLVARQPSSRIAVAFLLIGRAIHRQQLKRVVRQSFTLGSAQLLRASLPRIAQRHHMIDLHQSAGIAATRKLNISTSVRVLQRTACNLAIIVNRRISQVALQNTITRIATALR